ncbi:MAG: pentatricopeptide repeat-containing protein, partial [Sweet potato little leaf phytoplasma]|nr:pentatricopeptide repeat-containing protein [Sweet potato little leaf phytoplasma]
KAGQVEKTDDLFRKMEESGCALNVITYNSLLRGFCESNKREEVVKLLHRMAQKNVSPDASTCTIVLDMLSKDENYQGCLNLLPTFPGQECRV